MTTEQLEALAEDYAAQNQFLSTASHFTPDAEERTEFERLFWEDKAEKTKLHGFFCKLLIVSLTVTPLENFLST